jgi:hypothetical protein
MFRDELENRIGIVVNSELIKFIGYLFFSMIEGL